MAVAKKLIAALVMVFVTAFNAAAFETAFFWGQRADPPFYSLETHEDVNTSADPEYATPDFEPIYWRFGGVGRYTAGHTGSRSPEAFGLTIFKSYGRDVSCWFNNNFAYTAWCYGRDGNLVDTRFLFLWTHAGPEDAARVAMTRVVFYPQPPSPTEEIFVYASESGGFSESERFTRLGRGSYRIAIGPAAGRKASVQVVPIATNYPTPPGWIHCNPTRWSNGNVWVGCFDENDQRVDSGFIAMAFRSEKRPHENHAPFDVLWSNDPAATSGLPSTDYSVSSDREPQSVRRLGTGRYVAELGDSARAGGHVQVSAYGGTAHCVIERWQSRKVWVSCYNSEGRADSAFTLAGITTLTAIVSAPASGP